MPPAGKLLEMRRETHQCKQWFGNRPLWPRTAMAQSWAAAVLGSTFGNNPRHHFFKSMMIMMMMGFSRVVVLLKRISKSPEDPCSFLRMTNLQLLALGVMALIAGGDAFAPPSNSIGCAYLTKDIRGKPQCLRGIKMVDFHERESSRFDKIKVVCAGALAATIMWPVSAAQAQVGKGRLAPAPQSSLATENLRGTFSTGACNLDDGRKLSLVAPRGVTVAKASQQAPVSRTFRFHSRSVILGAAALTAGGLAIRSSKQDAGSSADQYDEGEANKPRPYFDRFDECTELNADELVLTAWEGKVLESIKGTQLEKLQSVCNKLSWLTGWYGKTFGVDGQCQALVMKAGPLRYTAPFGLGSAKFEELGYRQRWSTVMKKSVAVKYDKTASIVDYLRRKDENTLMGVVCKGKDALAYFELKKLD